MQFKNYSPCRVISLYYFFHPETIGTILWTLNDVADLVGLGFDMCNLNDQERSKKNNNNNIYILIINNYLTQKFS